MTRMDEVTARQRAKEVLDDESSTQELIEFAEYVLATTNEPTMADAEWSDEEHYLTGAVDAEGVEVIMLGTYGGSIRICDADDVNETLEAARENPVNLTPNGKQYRVCEVTETTRPEALVTEEDYENAPVGTIVASNGHFPYVKRALGIWANTFGETRSDGAMAVTPHTVLRRGWGK